METINTTSSQEQRLFILRSLEERPHSTHELRAKGIYYPPARIKELRDKGYAIDTFYRDETDSTGLTHRVGVYVLHQNEVSPKEGKFHE
ncbi:transcriptional regulator [Rodentibacter trehalosifermentans]|uniref:Transcriptional regulator n=1 Tax=Rodentibacter trehalosifermentans TaxID=1908263 RepID=A0A1V3IUK3_9PAST|nr:helix-turn-helix domain-containing protein [Rodentibacter trehalosifermentans]OOF45931.1 transcriptional regulator [Rodentibacter trehalosifermentans]